MAEEIDLEFILELEEEVRENPGKSDAYVEAVSNFPEQYAQLIEKHNQSFDDEDVKENPSLNSLLFAPNITSPLWMLKAYYRYGKGQTGKQAERNALIAALKIARPILMLKGIYLPVNDDQLIALSESELGKLGDVLSGIATDPQFVAGVTTQLGAAGALKDPRIMAGLSIAGALPGGSQPPLSPQQLGIPVSAAPGVQPVQMPVPVQIPQTPVKLNPTCKCSGTKFSKVRAKKDGKIVDAVQCLSCGKIYTAKLKVRENPQPVKAIAVPVGESKPTEQALEKAKDQYENFNKEEAQKVITVKMALPSSEAPLIMIPDGCRAVEYYSPKETGNPKQPYRHEIKSRPPEIMMGFVRGNSETGDALIIFGKGLKIDDWIRG